MLSHLSSRFSLLHHGSVSRVSSFSIRLFSVDVHRGSGISSNTTGKYVTGFSVKDSDVWQNRQHQWRTIRRYQGQVKAIILDWAGTVIDCGVFGPVGVFTEIFKQEGVPITIDEARGTKGAHKQVHIRKITELSSVRQRWYKQHGSYPTQVDVDRMFSKAVPIQLACLDQYTTMITGAVETVQDLQKGRGLKIGSTTGYTRAMLHILINAAKDAGYEPDCYVAADEVPQARPFPFMVWQNCITLNVHPISAVVKVDDTADGVLEGITAGTWSVGLARTGNYMGMNERELDEFQAKESDQYDRMLGHAYELLSNAGAHYVIDDIRGLPRVIDDINRRLAQGEAP